MDTVERGTIELAHTDKPFARGFHGETFDVGYRIDYHRFDKMLAWLDEHGSSDVVIQTGRPVKASIGGELHTVTDRPLESDEVVEVVRHLYDGTGEGQLGRARDLDGSHEVRVLEGVKIGDINRYRYNITAGRIPGGIGYEISLRMLPTRIHPLARMNVEPEIVANIRPKSGMVLVTGVTGSGKSTLQSSIFDHILRTPRSHCRIVAFEEPIEFTYDHSPTPNSTIWQTEMGLHLDPPPGSTMSRNGYAIRNAMRRFPQIISVGEVRDLDTMEAAISAALTGHLFYSTLHATGVPVAISRMIQMFPASVRERAAHEALDVLSMVVTQRLEPRVGGGRWPIREFMVFDEDTKSLIRRRPVESWPELVRGLLSDKRVQGRSMVDSAWNAFEAGEITSTQFKDLSRLMRRS